MSNDNKAQFNILAKKVLETLVNACPMPVKITAEILELPKGELKNDESTGGLTQSYTSSPEEELLNNLLVWFEEEKYIRRAGDTNDNYVATLQTLKLCNAVPNAIAE